MFFFLFFSLEKILFGDMCCHPDCNPSLGHLFKHKRIKIIRWRLLLFYLYRATLKWRRWRRRQRIDIFAPLWFIHLIFAVVPDPLLLFFFLFLLLPPFFSMTTYAIWQEHDSEFCSPCLETYIWKIVAYDLYYFYYPVGTTLGENTEGKSLYECT